MTIVTPRLKSNYYGLQVFLAVTVHSVASLIKFFSLYLWNFFDIFLKSFWWVHLNSATKCKNSGGRVANTNVASDSSCILICQQKTCKTALTSAFYSNIVLPTAVECFFDSTVAKSHKQIITRMKVLLFCSSWVVNDCKWNAKHTICYIFVLFATICFELKVKSNVEYPPK